MTGHGPQCIGVLSLSLDFRNLETFPKHDDPVVLCLFMVSAVMGRRMKVSMITQEVPVASSISSSFSSLHNKGAGMAY